MNVTHKITMDLTKPTNGNRINVVEGDKNSRIVNVHLYENFVSWRVPTNASVLIKWERESGVGGEYSKLADGSSAWSAVGNVLTITLSDESTEYSGNVKFSIVLTSGDSQISTFVIVANVHAVANGKEEANSGTSSSDIAGLQKQIGNLSDLETKNKSNLVAAINEAAKSGGGSGETGEDGGYYTPKVSQPATNTMLVEHTPSKAGMPAVEPVTINLPVGEDSSQNASIPTSADLNGTTATFRNSAGVALFTLDLSGLGGTAATYGNLVLSAEELTITEGQSGTFTVALDTAPSVNQPVYLAVSDGTRLSVAPATLTFTPEDWETPQTVTVTSLEDDDELDNAITVTLTSESMDARQVAVAITENDGEFYELFNGKQVVSMILAEDIITSDTAPLVSYTDSATGETLSNDSQKLVWPFKSGVGTNLAGTPTKARTVLEANTSGAYSVLFVGTNVLTDNSQSNWFTGIAPAIRNYFGKNGWDTLATQLSEMRYTTASGEQSSVTITSTDLEALMTDLPDWFVHIVAFSFESDGTIVVILDGIEVYRTDAPVDFAAWDWDLDGHAWNELVFKLTPSYGSIIVNDALSAAEIDEFYTKYLAANFTSGETA